MKLTSTCLLAISVLAVPAAAQCLQPDAAVVDTIGLATKGQTGFPGVAMLGAPILGKPFALQVTKARPNATGYLMVGTHDTPVVATCCDAVLHPAGASMIFPFTTNAAGASKALAKLPVLPLAFCGAEIVAQAAVIDQDATGGIAFTRALWMRAGVQASTTLFGPAVPAGAGLAGNSPPTLADVDGDQSLDLIFAQGANVAWAHGNGDGTFLPPSVTPVGFSAADVRAADLDLDGDTDLIAASSGPLVSAVVASALLGDGAGAFTTLSISLPQQLTDHALGDLDGDALPDLVTAHADVVGGSTGIALVSLGNGDGTFLAPVLEHDGESLRRVRLADVDVDGALDLLASLRADLGGAQPEGALGVALGNGDGTLGALARFDALLGPELSEPFMLEVSDMNLDGLPDAVCVGGGAAPTVTTLLGDGAGGFTALASAASPEIGTLALEDFDGDAIPDALVGLQFFNSIELFPGLGDGTFAPRQSFPGGYFLSSIATGDLDGDLDPDVVQTSSPFGAAATIELHLVD